MSKNKSKRNADTKYNTKYKSFGNKQKFNGLAHGCTPVIQIASAFLLGYSHDMIDLSVARWEKTGNSLIPWDTLPLEVAVCRYHRGAQEFYIEPSVRSAVARLGFSADEILDELLHSVITETNMPVVVIRETEDIEAVCTAPLNVLCRIINTKLTEKIRKNAS